MTPPRPSAQTLLRQAKALEAEGWERLEEARRLLNAAGGQAQTEEGHPPGYGLPDLWRLERALQARHGTPAHFSQLGQDWWLERHVFRGLRDGFFLDIGGYDGFTGSNTLFFELHRGWSGLLFEPSPVHCARAAALRRCPCHPVAIGASEGQAPFLLVEAGYTQMSGLERGMIDRHLAVIRSSPHHREQVIQVPVRPVTSYLREAGIRHVDYVSLDVEGAEAEILEGFPFSEVTVSAWSVENPYGDSRIPAAMTAGGYALRARIGVDDIYLPA